ncbi:MAG TPA: FecR family protein [Pyrinomonadaceae bacterium]|jgi:F0F1-type ATP synthase epsilon subunit
MSQRSWFAPLVSAAFVLSLAGAGLAQTTGTRRGTTREPSIIPARDMRVISARAGGVNFVAGEVLRAPAGSDVALRLTVSDELRVGDVVKTGGDGRVEVLLNPGSYLRVGGAAEFVLLDDSFEHLRFRLNRGAVVAEVIGFDDGQPALWIETPQTQVTVLRSGVYHVAAQAGATEVAVFKGRAEVTPGAVLVKGERKAVVTNGSSVAVAKFKRRDETDALDTWSRERAETLAKANDRVTRNRELVSVLARITQGPFWGPDFGWGRGYGYDFRGNGYWVYDSFAGSWVFVPFYWRPVSCPYGFNYNNTIVVTPPPGLLPNDVPCRGCASNKLPDQHVGGGDFSDGGGFSKGGGGISPKYAPPPPAPSADTFYRAPKQDISPPPPPPPPSDSGERMRTKVDPPR